MSNRTREYGIFLALFLVAASLVPSQPGMAEAATGDEARIEEMARVVVHREGQPDELQKKYAELVALSEKAYPALKKMLQEARSSGHIAMVMTIVADTQGDKKVFIPVLRELLARNSTGGTKDMGMQLGAMVALGRIGTLDDCEMMYELLNDENETVRTCAAGVLGSLGDIRAGERMQAILEQRQKGLSSEEIERDGSISWARQCIDTIKRRAVAKGWDGPGASVLRDYLSKEADYSNRLSRAGVAFRLLRVDDEGVWLVLNDVQRVDLSPLAGIPVTKLEGIGKKVTDLGPLKGMPLKDLDLRGTTVSNLSPLTGMALTSLGLSRTPVRDLSPLKGMPLRSLLMQRCLATDLSPISGSPLDYLSLTETKVSDLSALKGIPLKELGIRDTEVTDLSPISEVPLIRIEISPGKIQNGLEMLRQMKTLKEINFKPVQDFWKEYDAKKAKASGAGPKEP